MKISHNWLQEYIDTELKPSQLGEILTNTGLEVESIEKFENIKGGLEGVVVGEILTINSHPDADRLRITTVNVGVENPLQIVCGANNIEVGQKVLVATIGCTIYPNTGDPIRIKSSKIRGVQSEGMICAENELGIGNSHEGILVLETKNVVGARAASVFDIHSDFVYEIGLTPNRSDAMSHVGVARDLKAYLNFHKNSGLKLNLQLAKKNYSEGKKSIEIKIDEKQSCPRYSGAVISNIKVSSSPKWLQNKLKSVGLKPINNIVDITNFVMLETGNPLHAFDLNTLDNKIVVRGAKENEEIITLDGQTRKLKQDQLVICNAAEPLCIAGIFGGLNSGVKFETTGIFLEAAYFDSSSIRKTSKSHNLSTDSSFRFERGVDSNNVTAARDRAIDLIIEITGGELVELVDIQNQVIEPCKINFSFNNCRKICGASISDSDIIRILEELEIKVSIQNDNAILEIPTYRVDVTREADVIEEVLRIYGFNLVPIPEKLNSSIILGQRINSDKVYTELASLLTASGFYEIMNNSLSSSGYYNKIDSSQFNNKNHVTILNPLSNELDILRQTLIIGGLQTIEHNQNRQCSSLKLYEFGKVYLKQENGYQENQKLAIFISGEMLEKNWNNSTCPSNFYHLKGIIDKILEKIGVPLNYTHEKAVLDLLDDGISIHVNKKCLVNLGWIKNSISSTFGVKNLVFYAEFDWQTLMSIRVSEKTTFQPIPKTQFVRRDFSLLLDKSVKFEQLKSLAFKTEKSLLRNVGLFDVYEGKNLDADKKSYALSFTFQDNEKTLQDKQIDEIMNKIRLNFEKETGATLR